MARTRRPGEAPALVIDAAPAYEFLMSVAAVAEPQDPETLEVGIEWLEAVRARAGEPLLDRIRAVSSGDHDMWINLATLVYDSSPPRDVAGFLDRLRETDADEIRLHTIGFYSREIQRMTPPDVIRRAFAGDREAAEEFLRTSYPDWEPWQAFLRDQLQTPSAQVKAEMLDVLQTWADVVWSHEEARILPILQRDADEKRDLQRRMAFERFIETATNGVEWVPRPHICTVVLVPSFVFRPWVSTAELGDTLIHIYPVSDESVSAETDAPPLRLVRLSKALGDEKRLRILRALAESDRTLMELAEQFGQAKTSMHHHMVILRSAGLVSVGAGKRYRLRQETLPDVGELLSGYLGAPIGPSAAPGPAASPAEDGRASGTRGGNGNGAARRPRRRTRPRAGARSER
jgi:DNA-binding transcriptional ArsR family regulator